MDRRIRPAGVFLAAIVLVGCAITPVERQEATHQALIELREAMKATRAQIDKALSSLGALMNAPEERLRESYEQFAKDVDTIMRQADRVDRESRQMKQRSDTWLANWRKAYQEVKNPELRAIAERRQQQVLERFYKIDGSLGAAREALVPFVRNLQDLNKVIGYDLTPVAIAAVSKTQVVQNANATGAAAARAMDVAIADLPDLIDILNVVLPPR